jgi:hypothetical protein
MPTLDDVFEFGVERIEPAIEESPYLQTRIRGKYVRNKRLKRIGQGFLHMRGSNSKSGAQSIPAVFLFLDEADLLDQKNLPMILRRVTGAKQRGKVPKIRYAGYPLLPNTGIDAKWKESDQRVWHVVCPWCDTEQPITWEENVRWTVPGYHEGHSPENVHGDPERPLRVLRAGADVFEDKDEIGDVWRQCRSCEGSLEDSSPHRKDGALRKGRWIAQRPGARVIGFHVWRGMVPGTDLRQIVKASRGTSEAEREVFAALIERFRVHVCVVDGNPERRAGKALRGMYPGRVVLCEYDPKYRSEPMVLKTDDNGMPLMVRVNRTDAIDGMMDAIRQVRQIPLRTPPPRWKAQMKALVRRTQLDKQDRVERVYVTTGTDGDDYAHAATYALVATELWRAFSQAQATIAAAAGEHVDDETIGFRRVRLSGYGEG